MRNDDITITQSRLKELLDYDPEIGSFRWKVSKRNGTKVGVIAGGQDGQGYLRISIDGKLHRAHRLVWLYCYGQWPTNQIDHRNGIRHDNRIANLRQCSQMENSQNTKLRKDSTSGLFGVRWHKKLQKWHARIQKAGQSYHLGLFHTSAEAHSAYLKAKAELHSFQPIPRSGRRGDSQAH